MRGRRVTILLWDTIQPTVTTVALNGAGSFRGRLNSLDYTGAQAVLADAETLCHREARFTTFAQFASRCVTGTRADANHELGLTGKLDFR